MGNLKVIQNIGYNAGTKVIAFIFQAAANVTLSRFLSSSDFGIIAIAMVMMNFLNLFNDFGLNQAVIQKRDLQERELMTAFTMKSIMGIVLFAMVVILAPLGSSFLERTTDFSAATDVLRLLALNFLINSFSFIPTAHLSRELSYRKLSIAYLISSVLNSSVSIILVLAGFNYWSIVIGSLVSTLSLVLALNVIKPVKIRLILEKRSAREFQSYSGYLFVSGILIFLIMNVDNFMIGLMQGSEALGYYSLAFYWGSFITVALSGILQPVLFPVFSRIQDDHLGIKEIYLKVMEYLSFFSVLFYLILGVVSTQFLVVVLGHGTEKWLPSLVTLQVLCLYGIFRTLLEPVGALLLARGRTDILFRSTFVASLSQILLIYPALRYFGIEGVAVIVTVAYGLQYGVYFPFLKKECAIKCRDVIKVVRPSLLAFILVAGPIHFLSPPLFWGQKFYLFERVLLGGLGYILVYGLVTNWKLIKDIKALFGDKSFRYAELSND